MIPRLLTLLALLVLLLRFIWYPWFSDRMEQDMIRFLQSYWMYQQSEVINRGTYADRVAGGPLTIPDGLEILVLTASETEHAAVTRPRLGYPRMYCAIWVGPMPSELAPREPNDPIPTSNTLCDEPTRFEAWIQEATLAREQHD